MESTDHKIEEKVEKKFLQDYRIVLSAFMAGSGLLMWILMYVFSPIAQVKTDIALIQKDISTINSNHEAHIQDILKNIEELKKQDKALDDKLDLQQQAIIKLLK